MHEFARIVVDTNVLVSAVMLARSVPSRAVDKAIDLGVLLFSDATVAELAEVLSRPGFDRYVSARRRGLFRGQLARAARMIPIIQLVRECRDSKDDKFLEVALNGRADFIVTGDRDLLTMDPWKGIAILTPAAYLKRS